MDDLWKEAQDCNEELSFLTVQKYPELQLHS